MCRERGIILSSDRKFNGLQLKHPCLTHDNLTFKVRLRIIVVTEQDFDFTSGCQRKGQRNYKIVHEKYIIKEKNIQVKRAYRKKWRYICGSEDKMVRMEEG